MSTRAKQFDFLLSGLIHPTTLAPLAGGVIYFYEAGTSTPKNVWSEKEKTNPFTSITLGSDGTSQHYGEGIYKVVVKNSAETSTLYTWDNVKCLANNYYVRSVSTNTTATTDDDFISVNSDSGNITITLPAAADVTHPLIIKNTGSNDVIVDGDGSETIDGSATYTISVEDAAVIFTSNGTNWAKANDTSPYAATLTGLTAEVDELNTSSDGIADPPIAGDSTAGRVLRRSKLTIEDATDASEIKCTLSSMWNGDSASPVDNIDSTTGAGGYTWSDLTTVNIVKLDASLFTGNPISVLSVEIAQNYCGESHTVFGDVVATELWFSLYPEPTGANLSLGTLVDTGNIVITFAYLTDE